MIIKRDELIDFQKVQLDPVGTVYIYKGEMVRVIEPQFRESVEQFMKSKLFDRLIKEKLLVDTSISEDVDEEGRLILKHKRITPYTSMEQWSFEMMKETAKLVLKMNMLCWKHGYELKDCHQTNILFDGMHPVWIDFGSIEKRKRISSRAGWTAHKNFLQYYYYPMKLWSKGYENIMSSFNNFSVKEMKRILYHLPACIAEPPRAIKILIKIWAKVIGKNSFREMQKLYSKVDQMKNKEATTWGAYQDELWGGGCGRFIHEIEWINNNPDIESMTEIGANQGFFSYLVAKQTQVKKIIATDYDRKAVDVMYQRLKKENLNCKITPIVMDFVWMPLESLKKYRSDLVVANALTHHLLLGQGMKLHVLVDQLAELTEKYLIVEFMEYGLNQRKEDLPKWYTLDNFLEGVSQRFSVLQVKNTAKGRTMVIGVKKE